MGVKLLCKHVNLREAAQPPSVSMSSMERKENHSSSAGKGHMKCLPLGLSQSSLSSSP